MNTDKRGWFDDLTERALGAACGVCNGHGGTFDFSQVLCLRLRVDGASEAIERVVEGGSDPKEHDSKEVPQAIEPVNRQKELNSLSLLTVIVVLATVTMTFGAMIAVFVVRSQSGQFWGHIRVPGILWGTTAVLLASSGTLEAARQRLKRNDQRGFFQWMAWTTGLGTLFLIGQVTAWLEILHAHVVLARNPHSWFIFLFTGLHGLHIVVGLGGLVYLLTRTKEPASGPKYQMHTRAVANGVGVFWHYLDLMWVLLFGLLLLWRP